MLMRFCSIVMLCWCLSLGAEDIPNVPRELVVVSWNVLADADERDRRLPVLLKNLHDAGADVIAVQEATTWFVNALVSEPWAKDFKRVSGDNEQPFPGGLAVFTKLPLVRSQVVALPTAMRRRGLVVELTSALGPLSFGVVHLDSYLEDGPMRGQQLRAMGVALQAREDAVLLGDFNFGDGTPEAAQIPAGFIDAWLHLHANKPGFTRDIERSPMAKRGSFPNEPSRRLDRVLVHSAKWQATAMTILGTEAVPGTNGQVFPSDHFGVRVVLSGR
jgi:endonuclease/exonuclease/phosphatase family metal-dependent hydrolase